MYAQSLIQRPNQEQKIFIRKCAGALKTAERYEDESAQQIALANVPLNELQDKALEEDPDNFTDQLLKQLLRWFKHSFFSWVNQLKCSSCGQGTKNVGMTQPTEEDLQFGAGRVEVHRCEKCHINMRFPRYNDPVKLLQTRRGRCGEWANCFTLICRAVGYEVRYVLDWTDHVWTEAWSATQERWVHLDPCEAAFDSPLMYEKGWKKKLKYIIAFSKKSGPLDVTKRYSEDVNKLARPLPEIWVDQLLSMWQVITLSLKPDDRARLLLENDVKALSLLGDKSGKREPKPAEQVGRQTGSREWRRVRGELGDEKKHDLKEPPSNEDALISEGRNNDKTEEVNEQPTSTDNPSIDKTENKP